MHVDTERETSGIQLWEQFLSGGCPAEMVEANQTLQRWARCQASGLSAENPGEPLMALDRVAGAKERFSPLLAPGAPFEAFASTIAKAGFCGLLCDEDGLVVARHIAEPFETSIARSRLVEGALWNEAARGTNGVGTTLAEGRAVSIVGVEHYERRNHGLACYAAPVRDIRSRLVAVLDASGPVSMAAGFIHASVIATSAAIEALLVARTYDAAVPGGLFELERLLDRMPHATLVIESTGHIRRANPRFRGLLAAGDVRELAREWTAGLWAVPPSSSADAAAPRLQDRPGHPRRLEVEVEPIGDPADPFAAIVHLRESRRRSLASRASASLPSSFAEILGSDAAVAAARSRAAQFAVTDLPVLLLGESGTGKELFARAIHGASPRSSAAFMAVNAGTLTGSLLESELFGYAPGAFTGASAGGRIGKLAAADRGTLFLDEVGEMTLPVQAMLLRFLEDGSFYRVGESVEQRADVRLIAATSRDLRALVREGAFRSDLYFRMKGVVLHLPALRERSDRLELAQALLERIATRQRRPKPLGFSPAARAWIEDQDWSGNVRELRTALEFAVVLAGDSPRVERWHLPIESDEQEGDRVSPLAMAERTAVLRALEHSRGNLSDAARHLGVARSTFYRMLSRHGLREAALAEADGRSGEPTRGGLGPR